MILKQSYNVKVRKMGNHQLFSMMKKCSTEDKNLPIKIESYEALIHAIGLITNRSNKTLKSFVKFDSNGNSPLFDALTSKDVERNLLDFLSEIDSEISILTNNASKFKSSNLYKNAPKRKLKVTPFPQKLVDDMNRVNPDRFGSFLIGDEESLLLGRFVFGEHPQPTFVNFFDLKNAKAMDSNYRKLYDAALNGGEFQ